MIPETPPYNNYTGDGVTTQFDFDFYIESASQLVVSHTASDSTITTLVKDTDYSIHEIGNENGSYITFPIAGSTYSVLSSSEVITLQLSLPISQQSEYGTSSELDLESLEYSFDYLTRIAQIQNRQLQRSIKVAEGSGIDTEALVKSVNVIYANIDNINAVNNNSSNINTVSGNTNNINTVSGNISSVNSVAGDISNVNAVAGDLTNIDAVKANKTNIDTVAGVSSNVTTVAGISSAVTTVSGISSAVSAVSSNASNINAVAADISNVNAVAGDLTNIDAVNANKTNIDAVKNNASNINTVAGISSAVSNVSGISSAVTAVNSNASNINAVSADITNVNLVANDLENIDAASGYATSSKRYAVGLPSEPPEGSAKYWAGQAAQGQIQADWSQSDNTKKDYIKNKPTKVSDFVDDTATNPVDKADTLTGLTSTITQLNYLNTTTSSVQNQINDLYNDNDRLYAGVDLSIKFASEISGYANIYEWLNARKTAGNFSGIHVGDYINVSTSAGSCAGYSIPAQTHKCRIIGIDTYKDCADTGIGHMIYFSSDNVIDTPIKWNPTDNNNGTSVNNEPWLSSAAYAILNGINNYTTSAYGSAAHGANANGAGILQLLPSALRNVLKQKRDLLDTRYSSSGLLTCSTGWGWKDCGLLWCPKETEVYGHQVRSNLGSTSGYWNPEEGLSVQFPWFASSAYHRIKKNSSNGRCLWWLSSAASYNSTYVCSVASDGIAPRTAAAYASICLPLCFCI